MNLKWLTETPVTEQKKADSIIQWSWLIDKKIENPLPNLTLILILLPLVMICLTKFYFTFKVNWQNETQSNVLLNAPDMFQWMLKLLKKKDTFLTSKQYLQGSYLLSATMCQFFWSMDKKDTFLTSKLTCKARFSYQQPCASFSDLWIPLCNNYNFCHHNPTVVIYKTNKNQ